MKTVKMEVEFTYDEKVMYSGGVERNEFFRGLFDGRLNLFENGDCLGVIKTISVYLPSSENNRKWEQLPLELK